MYCATDPSSTGRTQRTAQALRGSVLGRIGHRLGPLSNGSVLCVCSTDTWWDVGLTVQSGSRNLRHGTETAGLSK